MSTRATGLPRTDHVAGEVVEDGLPAVARGLDDIAAWVYDVLPKRRSSSSS
ncbi:MAG: hypothetical protein KFF77_01905 [Bacteroidetes bacterium]|nr:hypothetical protein [Bacteroidota bacterium]